MIKISGVRSVRAGCWASRRVCPYRGLVCPCQGLVGSCDAMRGLIGAGMGFANRPFLLALYFLRLDFGSCVWSSRSRCVHILSLPPTLFYPPTHTSTTPFLSFPCVWEGFEVPTAKKEGKEGAQVGTRGRRFRFVFVLPSLCLVFYPIFSHCLSFGSVEFYSRLLGRVYWGCVSMLASACAARDRPSCSCSSPPPLLLFSSTSTGLCSVFWNGTRPRLP
jgi:hypothetical protein